MCGYICVYLRLEYDQAESVTELVMRLGPTFSEMRDPATIEPGVRAAALAAKESDPLDPINLYNITWRGPENEIY
jgi:hypothetical protein